MTARALGLLLAIVGCGRYGFAPVGDDGRFGDGSVDATTLSGDAAIPGINVNVAFVTAADIIPGALGGLAGADARCQADADAAGLPGQYVSWLSNSTTNAIDRLVGSRGWVRPDGMPVTDTMAALVTRGPLVPISVMANGTDIVFGTGADVATATTSSGMFSSGAGTSCMDWASTADTMIVGAAQSTNMWTLVYLGQTGSCASPHRLYCFGTGFDAALVPPVIAGQRRAFMTAGNIMPGGGLATLDTHCQMEASAAALGGTWLAFVATAAASAASRFDAGGATWVRLDGVPLGPTAADVLATGFRTSLNVLPDGMYRRALIGTAWLGAATATALGTESCTSWDSAIASMDARMGSYHFAGSRAFAERLEACNLNRPVYCLEQ